MSLFFSVVPVSEAVATVHRLTRQVPEETVPLADACGRVLAADVHADVDIPGFTRSVMDGYAVRAAIRPGPARRCRRCSPSRQDPDGADCGRPVKPGECIYIPTGGILPEGTDAVVMAENTEPFGDEILVKKPVATART